MSTLEADIHAESPLTMGLEEAMRTRRSVHYFEPGAPLTEAQWRKLFDLTALSPSSFNFQPWDFVLVEDAERRKELQDLCMGQRQVVDSSAVIAVLGDKDPHRRDEEILQQFRDNGYIDEATHQAYLGAVDMVYPNEGRRIEHAVGGASLAAMSLMLAAHGMGLATLPMIGFDPVGVQKFFAVPDDHIVTMLIAIGHSANKELPRQQRRGFDDIVHWDRFNAAK